MPPSHTTPPPTTVPFAADLRRVEQALTMAGPRWTVQVLDALREHGPLRYVQIQHRVPGLGDASVTARLRALTDDGLLDPAHHAAWGEYLLTDRGHTLATALAPLADWATAHLDPATGPLTTAEQIEDALLLITPRSATAIVWTLRAHGPLRATELGQTACPHLHRATVSNRLRQLTDDGLIERTHPSQRAPYQLTAAATALAATYTSLSHWAAGTPEGARARHPVWNAETLTVPAGSSCRASNAV